MTYDHKKIREELGIDPDVLISPKRPDPTLVEESFMDALSHEGLFSPEECTRIIGECLPVEWEEAPAGFPQLRKNENRWVQPDQDTIWLFDKLLAIAMKANDYFKFNIDFFDAVQIVKYEEGDFCDWHFDAGPAHTGNRKLSLTVQLSAPEDYEGGELVLDVNDGFHAPRAIGSVTVFPSFVKHKVTEVTKGTRYSLVIWCSGTTRFC